MEAGPPPTSNVPTPPSPFTKSELLEAFLKYFFDYYSGNSFGVFLANYDLFELMNISNFVPSSSLLA